MQYVRLVSSGLNIGWWEGRGYIKDYAQSFLLKNSNLQAFEEAATHNVTFM